MINSIPNVLIENILKFVDAKTLPCVRSTCTEIKSMVSNDENNRWKKEIDKNYMGEKIIIKCNSNMITALSINEYIKNKKCFNCDKSGYIFHTIYNAILCNECRDDAFFKMVPLNKTCNEYFISPKQIKNMNIPSIKYGNGTRVLEKDVIKFSLELHTFEGLNSMREKRYENKRKRVQNKYDSLNNRLSELRNIYNSEINRYPERVDTEFTCMCNAIGYTKKHNIYDMFGDLFELKVSTNSSIKFVSRTLVDFVWMLTFMRKKGMMDEDYHVTPEYVSTVDTRSIILSHLKREHFYEVVSNIESAYTELQYRIQRMDKHINMNNVSSVEHRKKLSIIACVEDNIEFDESEFKMFIHYRIGNPVEIARNKRMHIFLNKYGYMYRFSEFYNMGYNIKFCETQARNFAIKNAHGIEIMHSVCKIDLPNMII